VQLLPPQNQHDLTRAWTWAAALGSWQLTARAMAQPTLRRRCEDCIKMDFKKIVYKSFEWIQLDREKIEQRWAQQWDFGFRTPNVFPNQLSECKPNTPQVVKVHLEEHNCRVSPRNLSSLLNLSPFQIIWVLPA
jgi:hypothetical protein